MMLAVGFSIAVLWVVALTVMYAYTAQSQTSIRDGRLQSIAVKILLSIPAGSELRMQGPGFQLRDEAFPDVERLTFQVWAGKNRLVVSTPGAPSTPLRQDFVDGPTDSTIAGITWRVFSISDRTGKIHVQVGNPRSVVDEELHYKALVATAISTLLLAFVGVLVWWAVRKALQPVVAIAKAVRDRQKFDLTALPVTDVPTEITPLVDSFNHLMHQLDQAVQGERRFIDDAAHELRTPLSALYAQTQVALQADTMSGKDAALTRLLVVVERSTRFSEQLLDRARLDAGTHAPLRERYDLDEIVVHIASEFDVAAQKGGRTLQLVTEPCEIQCDVDEIGILLRNLVDNALRYTAPGGQIRITCGHVAFGEERSVFLEVSDDGPGVPEDEQTAIFNRFHRVPGRGPRGIGIGLSLVASIARLHDASIETCTGIGNRGFCVRIVFPAAVAEFAKQ